MQVLVLEQPMAQAAHAVHPTRVRPGTGGQALQPSSLICY